MSLSRALTEAFDHFAALPDNWRELPNPREERHMNKKLPLWALCGRLWIERDGTFRYALSFNDGKAAKWVRRNLHAGSVVRGQVRWSGVHACEALARAGAPPGVVESARKYVDAGPGKGKKTEYHDEVARLKAKEKLLLELDAQLSRLDG